MRASIGRRSSKLVHVRRSFACRYQSAWSIQKRINMQCGQYRVYTVACHTPGLHPPPVGLWWFRHGIIWRFWGHDPSACTHNIPRIARFGDMSSSFSNILRRPGGPAGVQPNGNYHWVAPPLVHPVCVKYWKLYASCHCNLASVAF